MKNVITSIAVLLCCNFLFSQSQYNKNNYNHSSSLIINAITTNQFTVVIDNNQTHQSNNYNYNNSVSIATLQSGYHSIEVYEWKTNFWGKQKKEIIYTGSVILKQGMATTIIINALGQASINEVPIYNNENNVNNGNGKYGNKSYRRNKRNHNHCDNDEDDNNTYKRKSKGKKYDD